MLYETLHNHDIVHEKKCQCEISVCRTNSHFDPFDLLKDVDNLCGDGDGDAYKYQLRGEIFPNST